jgi:hypothetical protein
MRAFECVPTWSLTSRQEPADSRLRDEAIIRFLEASARYFSQPAAGYHKSSKRRK